MCARPRRESGNPFGALAIIASIFATALVIKVLPPATRPMTMSAPIESALPSRAFHIWSPAHEGVPSAAAGPATDFTVTARVTMTASEEPTPAEPTLATVPLQIDVDPGEAPPLTATAAMLAAFPASIAADHPDTVTSRSTVVVPFTKTGSAFRVAFAKTGSAIKSAASSTAGVFISNP